MSGLLLDHPPRRELVLCTPTRPLGAQAAAHRQQALAMGGSFIVTSGDRFVKALEINDLFEQESPTGRLYEA
jgi:hypothetical protein